VKVFFNVLTWSSFNLGVTHGMLWWMMEPCGVVMDIYFVRT